MTSYPFGWYTEPNTSQREGFHGSYTSDQNHRSGIAPTKGVAKELVNFFGRRVGTIGARTASLARGYQPLDEVHTPRQVARARSLGRALVARIEGRRSQRFPTFAEVWVGMLRRLIVRPLVTRNPEQFAGVFPIWQEKGWL